MAKWSLPRGITGIKLRRPDRLSVLSRLKRAKPGKARGLSVLRGVTRLKLAKPGRLLVFESTGTALYGVLAKCSISSSFTVSAPVESPTTDFATAVGEVLERLRDRTGKRLPKRAVLVTPSAAGELLPLPVNPKKPRPRAQMGEMVRWELEELSARQHDIWTLGALLMGRGYISAEQRREAELAAMTGQRALSGGAYGEIVTGEQIDECLALQEHLTGMDDELVTGWTPASGAEEEGRFIWYTAGMGDGVRDKWAQAFRKNGLFLAWIYPQLGAALPLIDPATGGWLLIDIRQEQFGLFHGDHGILNSLAIKSCRFGKAEPEAVTEAVREFIRPDTRAIYLSAPPDLAASLSAELGRGLSSKEFNLCPVLEAGTEGNCPAAVLASLHGAARHGLQLCRQSLLVRIAAQDPKAPGWKRREVWPWVALLLLAVSIGGIETYLRVQTRKNSWALELMDIEYNRKMKIKAEAGAIAAEAKRLEEVLAEKERELKERERLRNILDNVIRYRQELVPGILQALGEAIGDEVVIDLLEENADRSGFNLEGWALKDTEGQLFGSRLNDALGPWKYKVEDLKLTRGKGRLDMDGFILKLRLKKLETTGERK